MYRRYRRVFLSKCLLFLIVVGILSSGCVDIADYSKKQMNAENSNESNGYVSESTGSAETTTALVEENNETAEDITTTVTQGSTVPDSIDDGSYFEINYIDVGQACSVLLECDGEYLVFDGGNRDDGDMVVDYLKSQGVSEIDYVIASHPHEDHIGGLPDIFSSFVVNEYMQPDIDATTNIYKELQASVVDEGLTINYPECGEQFYIGSSKCTVLAPVNTYDSSELNNWSVVLKIEYGTTSYLLTGDIETEAESDIINSGVDLDSDILMVAHHGSYSSTSQEFLEMVTPEYAIISAGADNEYGHPHDVTLNRLADNGIAIYRTDEDGTIVITSDGSNLSISTEK